MTIAAIQNDLSTPEGFTQRVKLSRGAMSGGITSLLVGLGALGFNLFQIWQTMQDYPAGYFSFGDLFFVTQTEGGGRGDIWRFIYVYSPFILIPLGIALIIYAIVTKNKVLGTTYANYQSRGFVAEQRPSGLQIQQGKEQINIAFLSSPAVSEEEFAQAVQQYSAYLGSLDKAGYKQAVKLATGAGVLKGVSAATLLQGLPAAVLAAPAKGTAQHVVVIPAGENSKKLELLELKA